MLGQVADLLDAQGASPFRIRAYRTAAASVRGWDEDVRDLLEAGGAKGLETIPGVGPGIAASLAELLSTGRLRLLDRLRGSMTPEEIFASLPGIGPELAHALHEHLGVDTLEELEQAVWDDRIRDVPGFGPRRVEATRAVLDQRLSRGRPGPRWAPARLTTRPSVLEILSVDREYRERADAGRLHRIAPRRFNPQGTAWLPILHTERGPWSFDALFSNTGRAHRLGRTHDWVVVYFTRDGEEGQATVVTETDGPLAGKRVVRGREAECRAFHGIR